jgi:hypothetical protein
MQGGVRTISFGDLIGSYRGKSCRESSGKNFLKIEDNL